MIQKLFRVCLSLLLLGSALAVAPAAVAGPVAVGAGSGVTGESFFAQPREVLSSTSSSSSPSTSPSNPVDSGTGETEEAKETRVDYAPYVIGAIVVVTLVAAVLFWRKRRISHPSKPD